jgi:hypothetical protein
MGKRKSGMWAVYESNALEWLKTNIRLDHGDDQLE